MNPKLLTIPNLITLLGLLSGCLGAFFALRGDLTFAFAAIALAALFDLADGLAARLLGQRSPVGRELDSLSDVIGFGFAPAAILLELIQGAGGGYWGLVAFLLTAFAALRLAKFNVDERQTHEFRGLPTPAAGLLVGSVGYLIATGEWGAWPLWALLALLAALCVLMVSNLRMFSLKKRSAPLYAFLVACATAIAMLEIEAIPYIMGAYVAINLARPVFCRNHGS